MKRTKYQDPYNPLKVWEVSQLKGGFYLKQFIAGKQFGRGKRTTKTWLEKMGILEYEILKEKEKILKQTSNFKVEKENPFAKKLETGKEKGLGR